MGDTIQKTIFRDDENTGSVRKKTNGAHNATSRYAKLKENLEKDPDNQNWIEIDTQKNPIKSKNDLTYADLFAGAGGLSLGFTQAGFKKIFSNEIDKDASSTIRRNWPDSKHHEGKIEDLTEDMMDELVGDNSVDIVCGGPPCQGFSVAGLRNPHDPRNQLFKEYIRVVDHLKPKFIVLENVPGILTMQGGDVYKEIVRQFNDLGYDVSVRILEAAQFGAPQLRARAVFIGNRLGLPNPYPEKIYEKQDYKTIDEAIDDLKDQPRNAATNHEWTDHSKKFEERISKVPPGGSLYETFRDAFKRQYKGVPSMTAKENHGGTHIHYEKNRVLSARELARLQCFPDDFIFSGTMKRAYWQIGNAVPVLMANAVAIAIRDVLYTDQQSENKDKLRGLNTKTENKLTAIPLQLF